MRIRFRIVPDLKNSGCFTIHPDAAAQLGAEGKKRAFIRFGIGVQEAEIEQSDETDLKEIRLSTGIINELGIPLFPWYEIISTGSELVIGPYIGILAGKTKESINKNVKTLTNYLYDYESIGGAVLAFSLEGVNRKNKTVEGFAYDPAAKEWKMGIYNYPAVVFKRIILNKGWRNHFHSVLGDRIFNDYVFNKWEMHKWLSSFPEVNKYLPETILYNKPGDASWFVKEHGKAYIKPIQGSQGTGILKISTVEKGFLVSGNYQGERKDWNFYSTKELHAFLRSSLKKGKYLVQQAIKLIESQGRLVDFRLLVLKDGKGCWRDMGMVGRFGVTDSIVSNISSGGSAGMGEVVIKSVLGLSDGDVYLMRKRMSQAAIEAARAVEECGILCGNLGVDMGIDENRNLWIIEINNRDPNHTIAIDAGDRQMFYGVKLMAMLYAKKLAGFGEG